MNIQNCKQEQLTTLAIHLSAKRSSLLKAWRAAVDGDADLTTSSWLSRAQFQDHIPDILDSFDQRLRAWPHEIDKKEKQQERRDMALHGLHRWQQGFRLRELTREWGYLQLCLLDEMDGYAKDHPDLEPTVISTAMRELTRLCVAGVSDSAEQYWQLHQAEAAGHVRDLEQALAALNTIDSERAAGWHQAAHDLRGSVSVISMASQLLNGGGVQENDRLQATTLLQKGVSSLHDMLNNLLDLARLEAGHEQRVIEPFDASVLLSDFCLTMSPLAEANGLYLKSEGPHSLPVESDRAKVLRIVQNLVLNALKYTEKGGVVVSWESKNENDAQQWMVSVQDTGPGFHADPGLPIAGQLREATQEAHEVEIKARESGASSGQYEPAVTQTTQSSPSSHPNFQQAGEGIGLSIVKGLSDLMDATLELETEHGRGSTFRVTFPSKYRQ